MTALERTPHDPDRGVRVANAAWTARRVLADYRASPQETPLDRTERRLEAIEAALFAVAERLDALEAAP